MSLSPGQVVAGAISTLAAGEGAAAAALGATAAGLGLFVLGGVDAGRGTGAEVLLGVVVGFVLVSAPNVLSVLFADEDDMPDTSAGALANNVLYESPIIATMNTTAATVFQRYLSLGWDLSIFKTVTILYHFLIIKRITG